MEIHGVTAAGIQGTIRHTRKCREIETGLRGKKAACAKRDINKNDFLAKTGRVARGVAVVKEERQFLAGNALKN